MADNGESIDDKVKFYADGFVKSFGVITTPQQGAEYNQAKMGNMQHLHVIHGHVVHGSQVQVGTL